MCQLAAYIGDRDISKTLLNSLKYQEAYFGAQATGMGTMDNGVLNWVKETGAVDHVINNSDIMKSEFYISVPNSLNSNNIIDENGKFTYEYKYGREAGYIQEYVIRVPFSRRSLSNDLIERLSTQIPFTFELIESFDQNNPKTKFLTEKEKI